MCVCVVSQSSMYIQREYIVEPSIIQHICWHNCGIIKSIIPEVASSDSVLAVFHHVFYQFPSLLIRFKFNVSLSCRHPSSIVLPRSGAHFLKSPLFRLSVEWNKLPEHIRCVQSSVNFRIALML